jgi:hypothetical protein
VLIPNGHRRRSGAGERKGRRFAELIAGAQADSDDAARGFNFDQLSPNTRLKIVSTCLR